MLSLLGEPIRLCDGVSRREAMRIGGLGLLGLSHPGLLRARAAASAGTTAGFGRAKSCIVLFMLGGPPQHETWDPKPDAPETIKGDWKPIASRVPGVLVGELMPRVAQRLDKLCVLRAVSTGDNAHMSSGYAMLTGFEHALGKNREDFTVSAEDRPSLAGLVRHLRHGPPGLPSAVVLPETIYNNPHVVWPGQNGGFLGRLNDPWLVECDVHRTEFEVPQLRLSDNLPALRMSRRRDLLSEVDRHLAALAGSPAVLRHDQQFVQAFDLLRGTRVRRAFDLEREDPRLRDRYGHHKWGQCCLLARRLVESGVSLVQVNWPRDQAANTGNPGWDIHNDGTNRLKDHLMPPMDQGFSALLDDLDARGLLDETLVVWMGEFGRTPRINAGGSRDHWGSVFSVALAGAGIRGGHVHGASDRIGGQPKDGRVVPADLAATILSCLGIAPETEVRDTLGRPLAVNRGSALQSLF
ncbi:MAG: DUF1501 domain-containing protein [Isosphaeraceae bacterium]|nr:DUF1501 domain-containing protein [Isosphaeraceae bacterium]